MIAPSNSVDQSGRPREVWQERAACSAANITCNIAGRFTNQQAHAREAINRLMVFQLSCDIFGALISSGPDVGQRLETGPCLGDRIEDIEQVAR